MSASDVWNEVLAVLEGELHEERVALRKGLRTSGVVALIRLRSRLRRRARRRGGGVISRITQDSGSAD